MAYHLWSDASVLYPDPSEPTAPQKLNGIAAFIVSDEHSKLLHYERNDGLKAFAKPTSINSNAMEIAAVILGLKWIKENLPPSEIKLHIDTEVITNALTKVRDHPSSILNFLHRHLKSQGFTFSHEFHFESQGAGAHIHAHRLAKGDVAPPELITAVTPDVQTPTHKFNFYHDGQLLGFDEPEEIEAALQFPLLSRDIPFIKRFTKAGSFLTAVKDPVKNILLFKKGLAKVPSI